MYLIDCDTLALKWFPASRPPYAILSHTWGPEEVTFAEFSSPSRDENGAGFQKIKSTCAQARRDGLGYVWVDTCCINKESSAELGEAINSMFQWYHKAEICYAYIEDLTGTITWPIYDASVLKGCRWFSRGWTLQELLAPHDMDFFGAQWNKIGGKRDLSEILEQITGIPQKVLRQEMLLEDVSVADRMSWAAGRRTTREEDIAYCLMGIFDVNMPMIYGEGGKAFLRLQDEIVKQRQDDSLFAWRASEQSASEVPYRGLFASSPSEFASDVSITPFRTSKAGSANVVGGGRVSLSCTVHRHGNKAVLGLKCFRGTDLSKVVGIEVISSGADSFLRTRPSEIILHPHKYNPTFEDVILERFAEKRNAPPVDDIYRNDALRLSDLPREISLVEIHSKTFPGSKETRVIPLVHLVEEKFAFELHVDRMASGVDQFEEIGWSERLGFPKGSYARVFIVLWVEFDLDLGSYKYRFSLEKPTAEETATKLLDASRPAAVSDQQQVAVGWAIVDVRGSLQTVERHRMFHIDVGFAISENVKAEADEERRKQSLAESHLSHERERKSAWRHLICALVATPIFIGAGVTMVVGGFFYGGYGSAGQLAMKIVGPFLFIPLVYCFFEILFAVATLRSLK